MKYLEPAAYVPPRSKTRCDPKYNDSRLEFELTASVYVHRHEYPGHPFGDLGL